jgi:hypothetical protein
MNERIKELAEQASLELFNDTAQHRLLKGFTEKFAELIVQKCADVAKYHTPDTEECEHTWLVHDKIKAYFGVK